MRKKERRKGHVRILRRTKDIGSAILLSEKAKSNGKSVCKRPEESSMHPTHLLLVLGEISTNLMLVQ
jgi:hypothetical protein